MKVFLSWAGSESRQLAIIFEKWLKMVLQSSRPWMSTNIDKGEGWDKEIHQGLKETKVGILFLTKESINSIYLHYEAGAISNVEDALVCTFLYDLRNADLKQPLSRFQATQFEKEDVFKLVKTINNKIVATGGNLVTEEALRGIFEVTWPTLQNEISEIVRTDVTTTVDPQAPVRNDRELLEEILEAVRTLRKSTNVKSEDPLGLFINKQLLFPTESQFVTANHLKKLFAEYFVVNNVSNKNMSKHLAQLKSIAYADTGIGITDQQASAIVDLIKQDITKYGAISDNID